MWYVLVFIWSMPFIFFLIVGVILWVEGLWRNEKFLDNYGKSYRELKDEWEDQKRRNPEIWS